MECGPSDTVVALPSIPCKTSASDVGEMAEVSGAAVGVGVVVGFGVVVVGFGVVVVRFGVVVVFRVVVVGFGVVVVGFGVVVVGFEVVVVGLEDAGTKTLLNRC